MTAPTALNLRANLVVSAVSALGPLVAYLLLHLAFGVGQVPALLAGAGLSVLANGYQLIRRGRLDSIGILVLCELAVSVLLLLITHNPRVLLFRPAVLIGVAGLYVLYTSVRGRPLAYFSTMPAFSRRGPDQLAAYQRCWDTSAEFRRRLRVITAAWGTAFLADALVRVAYALRSSITTAVVMPHIIDAGLLIAAIAVAALEFRQLKPLVDTEVRPS